LLYKHPARPEFEETAVLYNSLRSDKVSAVAGRVFVSLGLLLIALSLALPHLHVLGGITPNAMDFVRGLFFGVGIAFEIAGISGMVSARRQKVQAAGK
jgi:hypothetical protein